MSQQEFCVSGQSVEKGLHGTPKNLNITGHQRRPTRLQVSPTAQRLGNKDTRSVQLEVTATALENRSREKYWSPQASYSTVNQNQEGGDSHQVLLVDENSNVHDSSGVEASLSWQNFYSSTLPLHSLMPRFGGIRQPMTPSSSASPTAKVIVSSPRRIVLSSPGQMTQTPRNQRIESSTGLTPSLSDVAISRTANGNIQKTNLPVMKIDTNNNCSKAVKHTPKDTLDTIRAFLIASQQRVVVLKKNLVDYTVSDSSSASSEEDPEDLPRSHAAGGKRKLEENTTEKEEVTVKRKCVQAVTVKAEGKEGSEVVDVSTTTAFIGPIDTRCVTAQKNLETTLNVQRLSETFESKHYGRKAEENLKSCNQLDHDQNNCSSHLSRKLQAKSTVSIVDASPRVRTVSKLSNVSPRVASKSSDGEKTLKSYVSFVKSGENFLSTSSETAKSSWSLAETKTSDSVSVVSRHPVSEQSVRNTLKGPETPDEVANTPKQPFWASHLNSTGSLLMGQQDNETNEEVTSTLRNHFRTRSAPVSGALNKDPPQANRSIDLDIRTSSTVGASSGRSQRLRFYERSRLSALYSPPPNLPSRDWKEDFRRTSGNYGVPYLDSHCHLDFLFNRGRFTGSWSRFKAMNQDTFPENFAGCVAVFCNPLSFRSEGLWRDVAHERDVWLAFGCHPKSATDFSMHWYNGLKTCLQHEKVVALGEIGLDYSGRFKQHMDIQKIVFRKQIQLALEMKKPLVIHCREAEDDCLQILQEMVPRNYKIHCHCFTGDYKGAQRWMEAFPSLFIGLTPMVTYRQCVQTHNVARHLPLNKLLLETDAPYFLPRKVPKEEMSLSHPGMAITVAERVAYFQQCSVQEVLQACRNNMREMYSI